MALSVDGFCLVWVEDKMMMLHNNETKRIFAFIRNEDKKKTIKV